MFRTFDRRRLLFALAGSVWTFGVAAQTPRSVEEVISELRDMNHATRMTAVEAAVVEVRDGRISRLLDDPDFEKALFVVVHDVNDRDRRLERNPDPAESPEAAESRADEMNLLAEVFIPAVPLLGVERQGVWAPELFRTLSAPDSFMATWLAEFGSVAVDGLIEKVNHPEIDRDRINARGVLAQMVAVTAAGRASRQTRLPLSFADRQKAVKAVRDGFDVNDFGSRAIVQAFRRSPSAEGLAILQDFARRSRGEPAYSRRLHPGLKSLQEEVDDAIQSIQLKVR